MNSRFPPSKVNRVGRSPSAFRTASYVGQSTLLIKNRDSPRACLAGSSTVAMSIPLAWRHGPTFLSLCRAGCYPVHSRFSGIFQGKAASVVAILVQKFGGTSVATAEKILAAAGRAVRAKRAGNQVVVVVSARGHKTDELIRSEERSVGKEC